MRRLILIFPALAAAALGGAGPDEHAPPAAPAAAAAPAGDWNRGEIGRRIAAARPGDTLLIPAGIYREHIRIDKPLRLVAERGAIIDGGSSGDIVEIAAPDVTLRGFTIRNTGIDLDKENAAVRVLAPRAAVENNTLEDILFGIDLREAPNCVVRGNRVGGKDLDIARRGDGIRLWRADNAIIEGNTIHDGRDAILWYSTGVTVRNNRSYRCRYGLHLMFSDDVTIEGNELSENSVGVYIMYSKMVRITGNRLLRNRGPSGYGIGLKETDLFSVQANVIAGNRIGIYLDGSPFTTEAPGEFSRNTIAYNDVGITFMPAVRGNELTENNFIDNIEQVSVGGRGDLAANRFWKGERGNFWTDYAGYDENRDGVGDFVHETQTLFDDLMDREPKLRILLFSPAQQAVEFVGRALPAVLPEPKFTDEVPLMRPVVAAGAPGTPPGRRAVLAATSGALLALGIGIARAGIATPEHPWTARFRRREAGAP